MQWQASVLVDGFAAQPQRGKQAGVVQVVKVLLAQKTQPVGIHALQRLDKAAAFVAAGGGLFRGGSRSTNGCAVCVPGREEGSSI